MTCPAEPIINIDKARHLFNGVDAILEYHRGLLLRISERLDAWSPENVVGDVFDNINENVGQAYTLFTRNFYKAVMFITYQEQDNARFVDFLNNARQASGCKYSIHDLLILPIQRFPHYSMLLERLIKITPDTHPDHPRLIKAQESVKGMASLINEKQLDMESHQHLKDLEARMAGSCPPMAIGNRRYVREVQVTMLGDGQRQFRHLFIFNDALLCVTRANNLFYRNMQFEFEWMFPIGQVRASPLPPPPPICPLSFTLPFFFFFWCRSWRSRFSNGFGGIITKIRSSW